MVVETLCVIVAGLVVVAAAWFVVEALAETARREGDEADALDEV